MRKAVLISIKPEWCTLISRKEKTLEVRKSKPKIKAPFKCYIYCTKKFVSGKGYGYKEWAGAGKVIGEFICDAIITDHTFGHDPLFYAISGMSAVERAVYCTERNMYGWHISDLKIYDRPKELREFRVPCAEYERDNPRCGNCRYYYSESNESIGFYDECRCDGLKYIERAPQSWCYVEEREDNG